MSSVRKSSEAMYAADVDEAETGYAHRENGEGSQKKPNQQGVPQPQLDEPFARFCTDGAIIWKQYMDRAKIWDDEFTNVLNGDLDPLLIFAGLFSAILSAFLIEVRKGLQEDLQDTTNALLRILVQEQRNLTTITTTSRFEPTTSSRWINGLWFSSLIFSLMSALGASLAKGWVTQYSSTGFGTTWRDAYSHRRRFMGAMRWRMKVVIQGLPIFIHIAFFLFAAGLVILLFDDDTGIGVVVLALVVIIAALYISSTAHPFYSSDSPFRTPISNIISWSADRLRSNQADPTPMSSRYANPEVFKAQALAWLLLESADSSVILDTVRAIAGLPAAPYIQDELYQGSIATILLRGLLENMDERTRSLDALEAYLHATLRLVQAGPKSDMDANSTVRSILTSMVGSHGPLHIDACNKLDFGLREVALCVHARIRLIFEELHDNPLFNMDIPVLFKSSTQPLVRRLLLEVYILRNRSGFIDREPKGLNNAPNYLSEIKSDDVQRRENGHKALLSKAISEEDHLTSVSTYGVGTILNGLSSPSDRVFAYLQKGLDLCVYDAFRRQICEHGFISQLYGLLKGEDKTMREEAAVVLQQLANYDDTWDDIDREIVKGLQADTRRNGYSVGRLLTEFVKHQGFRLRVITPALVCSILSNSVSSAHDTVHIFKLGPQKPGSPSSSEKNTQRAENLALQREIHRIIKELAFYDDTRPQLVAPVVINAVIMMLKDGTTTTTAFHFIGGLAKYDDVRSQIMTPNLTKTVLAKLEIQDSLLYDDDVARPGTETIIKISPEVSTSTLIEELAQDDDIRAQIVTPDIIKVIVARLGSKNLRTQLTTLHDITKLVCYEDIARQFVALGGMETTIALFESRELGIHRVQKRMGLQKSRVISLAALEVVAELAKYGSTFMPSVTPDVMKAAIALIAAERKDHLAAYYVIVNLARCDDFRVQIVTSDVMKIIIAKWKDDGDRFEPTLLVIEKLAQYDDICVQIMTSDVIKAIFSVLEHEPRLVSLIKELTKHGDIRAQFVAPELIDVIVTKLRRKESKVRIIAGDVIEELIKHDDIRAQFVMAPCFMDMIIGILEDSNSQAHVTVIKLVAKLAKHEDIRTQFMTPQIMRLIFNKVNWNTDFDVQNAIVDGLIELVMNAEDARTQLALPYIVEAIQNQYEKTTVGDSNVRKSIYNVVEVLAKHENINTQLLPLMPCLIYQLDGPYWKICVHIQLAALNTIVELEKYREPDICSQLSTERSVRSIVKLMGNPDEVVRQTAASAFAKLRKHDDFRTKIVTVMDHITAKLKLYNIFLPDWWEISYGIGELVKHDNLRSQIVTQELIDFITQIMSNAHSDPKACGKLLSELTIYDDLHTKLTTRPLIEALVSSINVVPLDVFLAIAGISDAKYIFRTVITLLTGEDRVLVKKILPAVSHLAQREEWRRCLCLSFQWNVLADLLRQHDTRNIALQVLCELVKHDDISDIVRMDSSIVSALLSLLREQGDIESWAIGAQGLLALKLF